jgi:hypothetical protein
MALLPIILFVTTDIYEFDLTKQMTYMSKFMKVHRYLLCF